MDAVRERALMSVDVIQQVTDRLLRQVPPHRRPPIAKAAAEDRFGALTKVMDAWLTHVSGEVRFLLREQTTIAQQFTDTGGELADLRKRVDDLCRADAL